MESNSISLGTKIVANIHDFNGNYARIFIKVAHNEQNNIELLELH